MRIDGKTLVLGLIGDPVEHTLSPLIHNSFAECLGLDSAYLPFHVAKEGNDLEEAVRGAYALGIRGLNVTVPHKTNVMRFLKAADPAAEKIGAVNTLVRAEGGFIGYNTDITGLDRDLAAHGEELKGKNVLLIGAGVFIYGFSTGPIIANALGIMKERGLVSAKINGIVHY